MLPVSSTSEICVLKAEVLHLHLGVTNLFSHVFNTLLPLPAPTTSPSPVKELNLKALRSLPRTTPAGLCRTGVNGIEWQRAKTAESLLAWRCGCLLTALTHFQVPHLTQSPFLSNILHTETVLPQSVELQWCSPCGCWEEWVCLSFCLINKLYVCVCTCCKVVCM